MFCFTQVISRPLISPLNITQIKVGPGIHLLGISALRIEKTVNNAESLRRREIIWLITEILRFDINNSVFNKYL